MREKSKFGKASIKYQLNVSPNKEKLESIMSVGHPWREMKADFIELINSLSECTDANKKQAVLKIQSINSELTFYKVVGTYLTGYKLI